MAKDELGDSAPAAKEEISDPGRVTKERAIGVLRSMPLVLVGGLSMYIAVHFAKSEADPVRALLPWSVAGVSLVVLALLRYGDLRTSRVWLAEEGLVVLSLRGRFVVPYRDVEGARVGRTPLGLPSRHPGYVRVRLRAPLPFVGRWVTTIAPTRKAALAATRALAARVKEALDG